MRAQIEAEIAAFAERNIIGQPAPTHDSLRTVLDTARRHGVPATSARFDEDGRCIVVEVARPRGHG